MKYSKLLFVILITFNSIFSYSQQVNDNILIPNNSTNSKNVLLDYDLPSLGAWFWGKQEFLPDGYKIFIDQVAKHSCYNILSTDIRIPGKDITDIEVYKQVKLATEYAKEKGIGIALSLDPRTARRKFEEAYPNELQESLWLEEVKLSDGYPVDIVVKSVNLTDHMNSQKTPYISFDGSLVKVISYNKTSEGADPVSIKDITDKCSVLSLSDDSISVRLPQQEKGYQQHACVMISYKHLYPDVFAPHLIEFTREIIRSYSDVPLAGGMRDEWGFPPSTPADKMAKGNHFWYSKYYADAYLQKTGGRDLLEDCFLMYIGIRGQESERFRAINHYMELNRERNSELEKDFYNTIKEVFGKDAVILSHPTWYPYPDKLESKKNGLYWWVALRDWAQTDEVTPFAARTALAKKWNSPVWYNQFYDYNPGIKNYYIELWSSVLAGGRLNYHPASSARKGISTGRTELLWGNLMRGESRVRLLNFISDSPLNCPVAVIFGHPSTMNWAGPYFEDLGMQLVDSLWSKGVRVDLIPTSEIENSSLVVDEDGWVRYGKQKYAAVILYNPEFEKSSTAEFFNHAAKGKTKLFRKGNWSHNFDGVKYNGNTALPKEMIAVDNDEVVIKEVLKIFKKQNIELQTPSSRVLEGFGHTSVAPPTEGFCHLIDGTVIQVAGTNDVGGDLIKSTINIGKHKVDFNAIGVAAVRLDKAGNVEALAAGGLKHFKAGDLEIDLDERVDIALWKDNTGKFQGVIQGLKGEVPSRLLAITDDWVHLNIPIPLSE